jgi:hypothetical protein
MPGHTTRPAPPPSRSALVPGAPAWRIGSLVHERGGDTGRFAHGPRVGLWCRVIARERIDAGGSVLPSGAAGSGTPSRGRHASRLVSVPQPGGLRDVATVRRAPAHTDALAVSFDGASAERGGSRDVGHPMRPATGRPTRRVRFRRVPEFGGGHRLGAAWRAGVGLITSDPRAVAARLGDLSSVGRLRIKVSERRAGSAAKRVSRGGPRRRFVLTGLFAPRKKRQAVVRFGVKQPP